MRSQNVAQLSMETLSDDFSKLLTEDAFKDVEIQCEEQTFKAHKVVLAARSSVFKAMLQSKMLEDQTGRVEVKDMKSDVCRELLVYMYCGKLPQLTPDISRDLYEAADRFNVGGLMQLCAEVLTKNLTPDNACELLILADTHSDLSFKDSVIDFILDKKIPLADSWSSFCSKKPLLANEVLYRSYRKLNEI